jgi:hypothetical protein
MNREDPYYQTWYTYWKWRKESGRRIRIKLLITSSLFFPVLYFVVKPIYLFFNKEWIYNFYLLLWCMALIYSLSRGGRPKRLICPKCGNLFFERGITLNLLMIGIYYLTSTRYLIRDQYRCVHCGSEIPIIKIFDKENAA